MSRNATRDAARRMADAMLVRGWTSLKRRVDIAEAALLRAQADAITDARTGLLRAQAYAPDAIDRFLATMVRDLRARAKKTNK